MQLFQSLRRIIHYNFKITLGHSFFIAISYMVVIPLLFSIKMLEYKEVAIVGELYLSILGIIFIPGIADIEDRDNIKETIYTRKTPHQYIYIIRLLLIFFVLLSLITIMAIVIGLNGGSFPFHSFVFGTFITSLYVGLVGLTISSVFKNITSGYLIAFAYYLFEFISRGKFTGDFYLFSLLRSSFTEKYRLIIIIIAMFIINIMIEKRRS